MAITAEMVKNLRERTGAGMMECKTALTESNGDVEAAIEYLRKRGMAQAAKRAGRVASEGLVGIKINDTRTLGVMAEVNCETDFVAKNDDFRAFANEVARIVAEHNPADTAALGQAKLASGETVEARRIALVQKIGENLNVRRFVRRDAEGRIASYVHGTRIGVLVDYSGGDEALGKDLAMHIAASKPLAVSRDQVPGDLVEKERTIAAARAAESGKPDNIVQKMVEGAVAKYLAEVTLTAQPFVKGDGKQTVEQLLKSKGARVNAFTLYVVGEGIERKKDDFAAEVAAMAKPTA